MKEAHVLPRCKNVGCIRNGIFKSCEDNYSEVVAMPQYAYNLDPNGEIVTVWGWIPGCYQLGEDSHLNVVCTSYGLKLEYYEEENCQGDVLFTQEPIMTSQPGGLTYHCP